MVRTEQMRAEVSWARLKPHEDHSSSLLPPPNSWEVGSMQKLCGKGASSVRMPGS